MYEQQGSGGTAVGLGNYDQFPGNKAITKMGIESAGAELFQAVEGASKRLSDLESRLFSILQPIGPSTGQGAGSAPTPQRSNMLDAMLTTKQAVFQLIARIDQLINRIEL